MSGTSRPQWFVTTRQSLRPAATAARAKIAELIINARSVEAKEARRTAESNMRMTRVAATVKTLLDGSPRGSSAAPAAVTPIVKPHGDSLAGLCAFVAIALYNLGILVGRGMRELEADESLRLLAEVARLSHGVTWPNGEEVLKLADANLVPVDRIRALDGTSHVVLKSGKGYLSVAEKGGRLFVCFTASSSMVEVQMAHPYGMEDGGAEWERVHTAKELKLFRQLADGCRCHEDKSEQLRQQRLQQNESYRLKAAGSVDSKKRERPDQLIPEERPVDNRAKADAAVTPIMTGLERHSSNRTLELGQDHMTRRQLVGLRALSAEHDFLHISIVYCARVLQASFFSCSLLLVLGSDQ